MAIFKETKIKTSILLTLTLLFLAIGVFPLAISNWKLISINRQALETSLQESLLTTTRDISTRVSTYINLYRRQVREFTADGEREVNNIEDTQAEREMLTRDPNVLEVRLYNTSGKFGYAHTIDFKDPRVNEMETAAFQQALEGRAANLAPYYEAADDVCLMVMGQPIRNQDDEVVGAIVAVINMDPVLEIIGEGSAGGIKVYVVDSSGKLLLHPNKSRMQKPEDLSGSGIVQDYIKNKGRVITVRVYNEKRDGKVIEIIGSNAAVADLDWGVIIQIEKGIAFQSVNMMIRESVKWGILFAMAAAVMGLFLARWITTPIQVLAKHAQDVGRNQNFDKKIRIHASNEIQQLADTFNYMTDEIKQNILRLQAAVRENKELFMSSIRMLSAAIDAKDPYTRGHSERVKEYSMLIGKMLGFNSHQLERLEIAALLHDVGKIGIDDRILRKPTNLTPEEFEIMKTHPEKGANILSQIAQLSDIIPAMRSHHENYDGTGYPNHLKADSIPVIGRVIAVADTFDAMTTDRPYQKAFSLEFALNRIRTMSGVKYDPKMVEAFGRACEEGKVNLKKQRPPAPVAPVAPAPPAAPTAPV